MFSLNNAVRFLGTFPVNALILYFLATDTSAQVSAGFISPDTVCTGQTVSITNTSTGGTTWYWSFCSASALSDPVGTNMGNPGNLLNVPSYMTLVRDGAACYSFIGNPGSKSLVKYNHGTSFSNNPISWTNLGGFGMLGDTVMGIKICYDNGKWIGFINSNNRIVRLNFGASLANPPVPTLLGPYAMLYTAHCLDIFLEGSTWVGYTTCTWGNKLVRLNFGNSLLNAPVLTDLGIPGQMNMPASFRFINESGIWYALVANFGDGTFTRLNFGSSLLNNPTGVNLGVICPSISTPGGISLVRDCESTTGFQLNYSTSSADLIWRLNFPSGINGPASGSSLGNIGSMSRPNQFSELIREGDTLFLFNTNRQDFTMTRLRFLPCANAAVLSSTLFDPPSYFYSVPGRYDIRLTVNEGMANQSDLCRKIVVVGQPAPGYVDTTLCYGTPWYAGGKWQTQPGVYHDTIHLAGSCDSIVQTTLAYKPEIPVHLGNDTILCDGSVLVLRPGVASAAYEWQDGSADSTYAASAAGNYWVTVRKYGCNASDTIRISACLSPLWFPNVFTPNGDGLNDTFRPVGNGVISYSILIFDRWGRRVFESNSIYPGWDGKMSGEKCSDGVYVFTAAYTMDESSGKTYLAKGSFTLLR